MRTCNGGAVAVLATLVILISFAVGADDAPPFASATDAYRQGMVAIKSGETELALSALEYAAERGVLGAQLKLARVYAAGNGVRKDEAKAFFFYRQIANQRADISPLSPVAKYAAEAFVALGQYYLQGVEATGVQRDPARAADLFRHAASYFGDSDAQYALARLYLDGTGVDKNMGLAVNWLATAAKKQHAAAQATLGELLWRGGDEVRQRPARGLALIMLAHANAKAGGKEPKWIEDLYREVQGASDAAMLQEAQGLIPELGGPAAISATTGVPDTLLVPASGRAAPKPAPVPSATAPMVSGDASAHPPVPIGVPVGFGETGSDSAALKP
jgi:TPR repeat protein